MHAQKLGIGKKLVISIRDVWYQQLHWEAGISCRWQQVSVRSRFHYCLCWAGNNHKTAAEFEWSISAQIICSFTVWVYRESSVLLCGGKFYFFFFVELQFIIHVSRKLQRFLITDFIIYIYLFIYGEKILSTPSFGGEVKPSVPCRRFAACKRSLNLSASRNLGTITGQFLAHISTFRC